MTYPEIISLIEKNLKPSSWVRVDNENRDGGNVTYCTEDVLLTVTFSITWKAGKPIANYQIKYGSTILGWFEIPMISINDQPTLDNLISALRAHVAALN